MAQVVMRRGLLSLLLVCLCWQVAAYGLALPGPRTLVPRLPVPGQASRQDYMALARGDAREAGIPPVLFVRQINQESGFDPRCNDPSYSPCISPAGAEGIAQFEPDTARGLGVDPWDPVQALWGAAQLMARYNRIYGSYEEALAAYNGGTGRLEGARARCGPAWLSCEPAETQHYVAVIMFG